MTHNEKIGYVDSNSTFEAATTKAPAKDGVIKILESGQFKPGKKVTISNEMSDDVLNAAIAHNEALEMSKKHKMSENDFVQGSKPQFQDAERAAYRSANGVTPHAEPVAKAEPVAPKEVQPAPVQTPEQSADPIIREAHKADDVTWDKAPKENLEEEGLRYNLARDEDSDGLFALAIELTDGFVSRVKSS